MEQTDSGQRGRGEGGNGVKERKRLDRQRTCMNDPRTWTTMWELTMGAGGGTSRGEQKEKY